MSREEEILKAKKSLFEHRAFWWVMEDLSLMKGVECETMQSIKALENIYKRNLQEIEQQNQEFKQGVLGKDFLNEEKQ